MKNQAPNNKSQIKPQIRIPKIHSIKLFFRYTVSTYKFTQTLNYFQPKFTLVSYGIYFLSLVDFLEIQKKQYHAND
jgi:hypothetical protein